MQLHTVKVSEFRGLDVEIDWKPAVVLFGPNDAGKTNILEALQLIVASKTPSRTDPTQFWDEPITYTTIFTLEHRVPGADRDLLARLLQYGRPDPGRDRAPATWRFAGDDVQLAGAEPAPLDELLANLRDYLLLDAQDRCLDWPVVQESYTTVVDACLNSRWFVEVVGGNGGWWCIGPPDERIPSLIEAAQKVQDHADLWPEDDRPHGANVAEFIAEHRLEVLPWLWLGDDAFSLYSTEITRFDESGTDELLQSLERFIDDNWERWGGADDEPETVEGSRFKVLSRIPGQDLWLDELDGETYRIHDRVKRACDAISARANEIAPGFVTSRAEVSIVPLEPQYWRANNGHRVQVQLHRHDEDKPRDLRLAGSGLAIWASYAIAETMRRMRGKRPTSQLYIIDEPERHLHPTAQVDVAAWLGDLLRAGTEVALATHAPAFLDIPYGDVEYCAVTRREGTTRTVPATSDLIGLLDDLGADVGFTRGEMFQLVRAVLIVEGEHDKRVIDHYYGHELRRERVAIVPIRGHLHAPGLAETQFLSDTGKKLLVLFDDTYRGKLDQALNNGQLPRGMSAEERSAVELVFHLKRQGNNDVHVLSFDPPDIIGAFPEEHMAETVKDLGGEFPGYDSIWHTWRHHGGSYKFVLVEESGLDMHPAALLDELMQGDGGRPLPGPLHQAIQEALDYARRT